MIIICFQSGRIGADEEIDDTKGKTMEEVEEMIEEREYKAGTQILEMVSKRTLTDFSRKRLNENSRYECTSSEV